MKARARLESAVLRDSGNDDVFLSAGMLTLLKMISQIIRKACKTQLKVYYDYNNFFYLSVTTRAVIGQSCEPYEVTI